MQTVVLHCSEGDDTKLSRIILALLFLVVSVFAIPRVASAQFSGTIAGGINAATNVEGIDTASPDLILQPAITLEYLSQFSATTILKFDFSHAPDIYTVSPDHTITTTTYGIGGTFYLSNLDAIKQEWLDAKHTDEDENPIHPSESIDSAVETKQLSKTDGGGHTTPSSVPTTVVVSSSATSQPDDESSDSIVSEATTILYAASDALDSIEYTGKNSDALGDLRDSASETISTLADVLDSIAFSVSVKEVALDELKDVRGIIEQSTAGLKVHSRILAALDSAVRWLKLAPAQGDYLPMKESITLPSSESATGASSAKPAAGTSVKAPEKSEPVQITQTSSTVGSSKATSLKVMTLNTSEIDLNAQVYTLLNATEQFRNLTFQDFDIVENIEPLSATTNATNLQFPCTFELDRNRPDFQIYDFNALTLEGTLETFTSKSVALDFTYDFVNSKYQNDSIFTNNENRGRFGLRVLLSKSTTLFGEVIVGDKNYTTQLYYQDSVVVPGKKTKQVKQVALASNFQLYVFGAGLTHFFGADANLGGLLDFSTSPNLRVFVTPLSTRARQQAAGITDDEYTYRLSRLMLFSNVRIFWSLDLGLDVTGERRKYGSVLAKDNAAIINATGADRSEGDLFIHADISRTFTYDDNRALSLFNLITLEAALSYSDVGSTAPSGRALPLYSYKDTEGTLTLTLGF